jgi:asparagine synthase (glutamine-hydrolysing)
MDPDIFHQGWQELSVLNNLRHTVKGISNERNSITALEMSYYMRNQLLRDTDWSSMAHGVEVRVPLIDIELFRATIRLQQSGFVTSKQDFAATPIRPMPANIRRRQKTGFSVPIQNWLNTYSQYNAVSRKPRLGLWTHQVLSSFIKQY